MRYQYRATKQFWRSYYALPASLKEEARLAWQLFKEDPFHPALRTHKINRLSARAGCTIWSASVASDARVIFAIEGDVVTTIDIGSHDLYRMRW